MLEAIESFCRTRLDENSSTIQLTPTKSHAPCAQGGTTTPATQLWSSAVTVIRSPLGVPTSFKFVAPRPRPQSLSVVSIQTPCKRLLPMSTVDSPLSDGEEQLGEGEGSDSDEPPEARVMTRSATAKRARRASHDDTSVPSIPTVPAIQTETNMLQRTSIYETIAPERLIQARCMDLRGEKLQTISDQVGIKMTTLGRFLGRHSQKHASLSDRQRHNIKVAQAKICPLAQAKLDEEQHTQALEEKLELTDEEYESSSSIGIHKVQQVDAESDVSVSDVEDAPASSPSKGDLSISTPLTSESSNPPPRGRKGMKRYTDEVLIACAKLHFQGRTPGEIVRVQPITSATLYDLIHCRSRAKMYSQRWLDRRARCLEMGQAQAAQEATHGQDESRKCRNYSA
ncbi:BQ2448_1021 [Microbotryum intermedium]|uniref:BQ2448_1021 protein n=1 Tax=Microbotryum intermedium TaxID=269621 RepID=A0A238F4J4_9BASI|nr:BQ2448_1021 [Microbotryum intermedium]